MTTTDVTAAFRFKQDVRNELRRKADLADLSMTEFLSRLIMSDAMPRPPLEERLEALEARLAALEASGFVPPCP